MAEKKLRFNVKLEGEAGNSADQQTGRWRELAAAAR